MSKALGQVLWRQCLKHEHTDVEILVGPASASLKLSAHRNVLAARSLVLAAMIRLNDCKEGQRGQVKLEDADPQSFRDFLQLLYTGEMPEGKDLEEILEILVLADRYAADGLGAVIEERLKAVVAWDESVGRVMMTYVRLPEESEYAGVLVGVMGEQLKRLGFKDALQSQIAALRPIDEDRSQLKSTAARGLILTMMAYGVMRDPDGERRKKEMHALLSQLSSTFLSLCELPEPSAKRQKRGEADAFD
mmetsp:Transcript_75694/g.133649  ORF Transcript_75694/g.133649 Transcript_75694/m.133649 type:complete len:248 (-) Transcript_75694:95-838(-)